MSGFARTSGVVPALLLLAGAAAGPLRADSTMVQEAAVASFPPTPDPVTLLPDFVLLDRWAESQVSADRGRKPFSSPIARSVAALCRYYKLPFDPGVIGSTSLSPLEWPWVFADETVGARRQRAESETLLAASGLAFRTVVTLETQKVGDSVLTAIADGFPVLFNSPTAPIVYGYDRREPDCWWWVREHGRSEIVFESERLSRYVFWDDDPAANLFWVITGLADPTSPRIDSRHADTELLRTVSRSVAGEPERGIEPYPLSLRRVIERLETSDTLPVLAAPIDSLDPIGVQRALHSRIRLEQSIERLVPSVIDSLISAPLRVAQYFYHNSITTFEQLPEVFYDDAEGTARITALRMNWSDQARREEAVRLLREVLRWERDGLTEVNRALAVINQPGTP